MSAAVKAVFLSYASQDADAARRICDALRAAGVEVWFDQSELRGGDAWDAKIRKQIKECALFVPIISANTEARLEGYFRLEWRLADQRSHLMAKGKAFLLPVVIDEIRENEAHVPDSFLEVQWTRLPSGEAAEGFSARVRQLLGSRAVNPSTDLGQTLTEPEVVPGHVRRAPATAGAPAGKSRGLRRGIALSAGIAMLILVAGAGTLLVLHWQREAVIRNLHEITLPEIDRRIAAQDIAGAFSLAVEAEHVAPEDPALKKRWPKIAAPTAIESDPPGADVYVKPFQQPQSPWRHLGRTPLASVRLPKVYTRWRVEKDGCAPVEALTALRATTRFSLAPRDAFPPGMVRVAGGNAPMQTTGMPPVRLADYLIDRCEVTNRQFKEFVAKGGYANADYWRHPFVKAGRTLTREEAMAEFRDSTGMSGPATWKNGTFVEGAAELPVTGVSWFEAAAYSEWAGKRLPSIFHWRHASRVADEESLVPLSNFSGKGLAAVGSYQGLSACGAYDMAGNAKEWCWNAARSDTRYILGGAWREPDYMFVQTDALSPFDRSEFNGFRCMKLLGAAEPPAAVDAVHARSMRDYADEQPVSDAIFRAIRSQYDYDKGPLESRVENVDDTDPRWRKERVSYRAVYGGERIVALLFLPKNSAPPFQTVVYVPSASATNSTSSEKNLSDLNTVGVLVASGRALIYPIYKGTYERRVAGFSPLTASPVAYRDMLVMLAKDFRRSIDYLETRADIQSAKLAYAGYSWGGALGAILPALDERIKVNLLIIGGFRATTALPEADQINFAPRNTAPTLMMGGRYDYMFPLETSQRPMFRWLGAPPEHKRHVLFETGHALKPEQIASAAYAWLDQFLGHVK